MDENDFERFAPPDYCRRDSKSDKHNHRCDDDGFKFFHNVFPSGEIFTQEYEPNKQTRILSEHLTLR